MDAVRRRVGGGPATRDLGEAFVVSGHEAIDLALIELPVLQVVAEEVVAPASVGADLAEGQDRSQHRLAGSTRIEAEVIARRVSVGPSGHVELYPQPRAQNPRFDESG